MEQEKRIVEVKGVKMEIDTRLAQTIETFKVGDKIKVLIKDYGDSFKSHPGAIIGFDAFQQRPTIIVAYMDTQYAAASIKFAYLNQDSKDVEIVLANEEDLPFSKLETEKMLDRDIAEKQKALAEAEGKKAYFQRWFGKWFANAEVTSETPQSA